MKLSVCFISRVCVFMTSVRQDNNYYSHRRARGFFRLSLNSVTIARASEIRNCIHALAVAFPTPACVCVFDG